jgi:Ca2+-binding EF-hand superfamily protein
MIDRDNSGYITVKELKTIFGGGKYSEDAWKDVMR